MDSDRSEHFRIRRHDNGTPQRSETIQAMKRHALQVARVRKSDPARSHAAWLGYLPGSLVGWVLVGSWVNWGYGVISTATYRPIAAFSLAATAIVWFISRPFGLGKQAVVGVIIGVLLGIVSGVIAVLVGGT